jgi:hypothetical protein
METEAVGTGTKTGGETEAAGRETRAAADREVAVVQVE